MEDRPSLTARLTAWERHPERNRLVRAVVAQPLAVAVLASVLVFTGALVHLSRTTDAGAPPGVDPELVGDAAPAEVGPRVGDDLDVYRDERHAALAAWDDEEPLRAVVSFAQVLRATDVPQPPGAVVDAVLLLVPGEAGRPLAVPVADGLAETVADTVDRERRRIDEELGEVAGLLDEDLGDPDFRADFERRLVELEGARAQLAPDAPLVFAAVVVATADTLRALVDHPLVRVVDPAGPARTTATTRFHGILPDDRMRASVGRAP